MSAYNAAFFDRELQYSMTSATEVVPHLLDLVPGRSVVDLGCGAGAWLRVFQTHGVDDIQGVDGPWIKPQKLCIDPSYFATLDLRQPVDLGREFDLALCLEVGEHLPLTSAEQLVASLTRLAPVVLFSAAIPGQGGTDHINEQWQSWWAAHFADRGYVAIDALRPRIWTNPSVNHWYCQNLLLYVDESRLSAYPRLASQRALTRDAMLDLVHPRMFTLAETSFPRLAKRALTSIGRAFTRSSVADEPFEAKAATEPLSA